MLTPISQLTRLALVFTTTALIGFVGFKAGAAPGRSGVIAAAVEEASQAGCEAPAVAQDEACYYAKECYQELIGCVTKGAPYVLGTTVVNSVVVGERVPVANTATCQFYGPDTAYSNALQGCSTDRLWIDAVALGGE